MLYMILFELCDSGNLKQYSLVSDLQHFNKTKSQSHALDKLSDFSLSTNLINK